MLVDTGHSFEDPYQDACMYVTLTDRPWQGPPPHGVVAVTPPAAQAPGYYPSVTTTSATAGDPVIAQTIRAAQIGGFGLIILT